MSLSARLTRLESVLSDDGFVPLLVVVEDDEGIPRTAEGEAVSLSGLDPRTLVVTIGSREDGPQ